MEKIFELAKMLWKKRWILILCPTVAAAAVYFLTNNQERKYASQAMLSVVLPISGDMTLSGQEYKQYETGVFFNNLLEMIKSGRTTEMVRLQVLADGLQGKNGFINFAKNPELAADTVQILARVLELRHNWNMLDIRLPLDFSITLLLESNRLSAEELQAGLRVSRVASSNFISIQTEAENPHKAAWLADAFLNLTIEQHERSAKQQLGKNREQLERLVAQAKKELDIKVKALETYKINNSIINLGEHTKAIVNQVVEMEIKVSQLRERREAHIRAALSARTTLAKGQPLPIDFSVNKRLLVLRDSLKQANEYQYSPLRPKNAQSQANIAQRVQALKEEIAKELAVLASNEPYDPTQARQDLVHRFIGYELDKDMETEMIPIVEQELKRLTAYASRFAPLESNIGTLNSEIHTAQESYLILLNKLNLARTVEQGSTDAQLSVLSPATLPRKPESSKRMFMVVGAAFGAFAVAAALFTARALLDTSIYTPRAFEAVSQIPLLATLGLEDDRAGWQQLRQTLLELPEQQRTVSFVSVNSSTAITVAKLALILQRRKQRVLLIDATHTGGANAVAEGFPVFGQQIPSGQQGCGVLRIPPQHSPLDTYSIAELQALGESWKASFDFVLIATPPCNQYADWQEWGLVSNALVQLYESGHPFSLQDQKAQQAFIDSELKILGAVFCHDSPINL